MSNVEPVASETRASVRALMTNIISNNAAAVTLDQGNAARALEDFRASVGRLTKLCEPRSKRRRLGFVHQAIAKLS